MLDLALAVASFQPSATLTFSNEMGFKREEIDSLRWALPPAESGELDRLALKVGCPKENWRDIGGLEGLEEGEEVLRGYELSQER